MGQRTRYEIEADWILNEFCNYACDYCFSHAKIEHQLAGSISAKEYLDFFNSTGKTWLFHFTGDEPLFYPNFSELCQVLSTKHLIALNSNLSTGEIQRFADLIDSCRVEYIHCGVHPQERESHRGYAQLMNRLEVLLQKGFAVFASCVMVPTLFTEFEKLQNEFHAVDVPLIPKSIRGNYQGKSYPASYTGAHRTALMEFSEKARSFVFSSKWIPMRNSPTINPLLDRFFLDGFPNFRGVKCAAGKVFVRIRPDGNVYRCGRNTLIGNLFESQLELFEEVKLCDDECCPYICLRYSEASINKAQELPKRPTHD